MLGRGLSVQLRTKVDELVEKIGNASEVINVYATFSSPANPMFNVTMSKNIKKIVIEQKFLTHYTDKIIMTCEVKKNDYIVLYNSRKDLQCLLEFTAFDPSKPTFLPEKPYLKRKYRALMLTTGDIFKQIPKEKIEPEDHVEMDHERQYFNVEFELISDAVYQMRKKKVNFMATTATMNDILHYTANAFGFMKAVIVPPDNIKPYVNFFVPPSLGINEIMHYYQRAPGCGVYRFGFCYYITDDVLFVFPRFGVPLPLNLIDVYSIGSKNYEGLNKFSHQQEYSFWQKWFNNLGPGSGKYEILCNSEITEKNWSDEGSENNATAYIVQKDDTLIDGMKVNRKDEEYHVVSNTINYVVKPADPISTTAINMESRRSHANEFVIQSELYRYQGTSIAFTWMNSRPFTFLPSTSVKFHYDDKFGYKCLNCSCEAVTYTIEQLDSPLLPCFGCQARVMLNHMNQLI